MQYRRLGQTNMKLSVVALGGLLAHYEGSVWSSTAGREAANLPASVRTGNKSI